MADLVVADYDGLKQICSTLDQQTATAERMNQIISQHVEGLRERGWVSDAADAFYNEFDSKVKPGLVRLKEGLDFASKTLAAVSNLLQEAERRAEHAMNRFNV